MWRGCFVLLFALTPLLNCFSIPAHVVCCKIFIVFMVMVIVIIVIIIGLSNKKKLGIPGIDWCSHEVLPKSQIVPLTVPELPYLSRNFFVPHFH